MQNCRNREPRHKIDFLPLTPPCFILFLFLLQYSILLFVLFTWSSSSPHRSIFSCPPLQPRPPCPLLLRFIPPCFLSRLPLSPPLCSTPHLLVLVFVLFILRFLFLRFLPGRGGTALPIFFINNENFFKEKLETFNSL